MALITEQDLKHMIAFPAEQKAQVMRQIMSKSPAEELSFAGNSTWEKTILKLRAGGLRLIELQPLETVVTTVWYTRNSSYLGLVRSEVAALVLWEYKPDDEDLTTVKLWRFNS